VERRQFLVAVALADADPDDADVGQRREHAQPAKAGLERADAAVVDRGFERDQDVVDAVGVGATEEFQRDVGLFRVGQSKPIDILEALLNRPELRCQFVDVDADEQSLHTYSSERATLGSGGETRPQSVFETARMDDICALQNTVRRCTAIVVAGNRTSESTDSEAD